MQGGPDTLLRFLVYGRGPKPPVIDKSIKPIETAMVITENDPVVVSPSVDAEQNEAPSPTSSTSSTSTVRNENL